MRTTALVFACTLSGLIAAQEAVVVTPQPGKASIVVFRGPDPALIPSRIAYHIAFDEQWISTLPPGKYFAFHAWPGLHRIEPPIRGERGPTDSRGSSTLDLEVKAGETYYIAAVKGILQPRGTILLEKDPELQPHFHPEWDGPAAERLAGVAARLGFR
jgi:hypothetical protein